MNSTAKSAASDLTVCGIHTLPPFWVISARGSDAPPTVAPPTTIAHAGPSEAEVATPQSWPGTFWPAMDQEAPPFVVLRMIERSPSVGSSRKPTAQPVRPSEPSATPTRWLSVPLATVDQVTPASLVTSAAPYAPTAHPCAPTKLTEVRLASDPDCSWRQVTPPSVVLRMSPQAPTR